MNHIFQCLVKELEETQVLGLVQGLILPSTRRQQLSPETSPPAAGLLTLPAPDKIRKSGSVPKNNTHFPKIWDDRTRLWQDSGVTASSTEVVLAVAAGKVALGLTTLTFVCFSAGHNT